MSSLSSSPGPPHPVSGGTYGRRTSKWAPVDDRWLPAIFVGATVLVGVGVSLGPVPGIAALVAVAAGLVAVARPDLAALGLVALVPVIAGVRRGFPVPALRISEILVLGIAGLIILTTRKTARQPWRAFDWIALAYVVITAVFGAIDVVYRGDNFSLLLLGDLIGPLQFFFLYRATVVALPTAALRQVALVTFLVMSIPVSLLALLQQFNLGGSRAFITALTGTDIYATTATPGWLGAASVVPRATGPFPHWHGLGAYLLVIVLLCVALLLQAKPRVRTRLLLAVLLPATAALIQTASFAPIIAAVGGSLAIGIWLGRTRRILTILAVAAVVGAVLFGPLIGSRVEQQLNSPVRTADSGPLPQTLAYRVQIWQQFVPIIKSNLITGYGPGTPTGLYFPYVDSLYLVLLLRGGVPLLACFLALSVALAANAIGAVRTGDPTQVVVGRVMVVIVAALVFIHFLQPYFLDVGGAHPLWILAGLLGSTTVRRTTASR